MYNTATVLLLQLSGTACVISPGIHSLLGCIVSVHTQPTQPSKYLLINYMHTL